MPTVKPISFSQKTENTLGRVLFMIQGLKRIELKQHMLRMMMVGKRQGMIDICVSTISIF